MLLISILLNILLTYMLALLISCCLSHVQYFNGHSPGEPELTG